MTGPIYSIEDLQYLMSRLRDPVDGCPWDKEQTFSSVVPHTIEECYELADAIERNDMPHIEEELGDVLFQVVFYAQLAQEQQQFNFSSIVSSLTSKLIRRHPHVFPDGSLQSRSGTPTIETEKVKKNWETIKSQERKKKSQLGMLSDIPMTLPAMTRAMKLQKRAAGVGFDWSDIGDVLAKIREEIDELLEAREAEDETAIHDEFGDLLFCCVNLARHLKVEPESALRSTNLKFERRFQYIEQQLNSSGIAFEDTSLEKMDALWDKAKQEGL